MHITKPGIKPLQPYYKGVCKKCGCEFGLYEVETILDIDAKSRWVRCPTCVQKVTVKKEKP